MDRFNRATVFIRPGHYRGIIKDSFGPDAKIDIVTCSGTRTFVITDPDEWMSGGAL